jgi:hypothetical protein
LGVPSLGRLFLELELLTHLLHNNKNCAVSRVLTEEHKSKRKVAALTVLERYHQEGGNFFEPVFFYYS